MKNNFLHFQHRRHSGSVLHSRHTSYRSILAVLVVAGIFMVWLASYIGSFGGQLESQASKSALLPDKIPFITNPVVGSEVSEDNIEVKGTCATNTKSYVVIYNASSIVGSSACSADGNFSSSVPAEIGPNNLTATAVNINNQATLRGVEAKVSRAGLIDENSVALKVQSPVIHYKVGKEFIWAISVEKGAPPISGKVSWGDSQAEDISFSTETIELKHIYRNSETRTVNVSIKDSSGTTKNYGFVADDITGYISPVGQTSSSRTSGVATGSKLAEFVRIIVFSLYAILALSIVIFARHQNFVPEIITLPEDFNKD